MNTPKPVQSKKPAPDTESWYGYIRKAEQETPQRLEDAAKFLATMVSLSMTLFLALGKNGLAGPLKVALLAMLLSLVLSFAVMFPLGYRYHSESVQSIKAMHRRIVRIKDILLFCASLLFLAALALLVLVVI